LYHCFSLSFQAIAHQCRTRPAEIAAEAERSAMKPGRELAPTLGVYRSVFEQSLLLNENTKRPWNFLASLGAELLVVSLALLIPLLYREHLPAVHWKDIIVGPSPLPEPLPVVPISGRTNSTRAASQPRPFRLVLVQPTTGHQQVATLDFAVDAPPGIATGPLAGETNMLGRFIPNVVALPPPPPKPTVETHKPPAAPVPVGGDVQMAKLLKRVIPEYPAMAKAARISGIVRLIGVIGKDGAIRDLRLVSGHPMLARAALEAVQQWVYKPTLLNGNPVEVIAPIEVNFTLGQ
jgi:protein TonB